MKDVKSLEQFVGFSVPMAYRQFLKNTNGACCKPEEIKLDNNSLVMCDQFFGLNQKAELNLFFWNKEFQDCLPNSSLIIGSSPGGGLFLMMQFKEEWKVMFYDHCYALESSSDKENTYQVSLSLNEFLKLAESENNA